MSLHATSTYKHVANWLKPPSGLETIGNGHADVAVDANGLVYVSAGGPKTGVQIYDPQGQYLRNLKNAPNGLHGFVIRQEGDKEVLLGANISNSVIYKMSLEGEVLLKIDATQTVPEKYMSEKKGRKFFRLTSVDLAPNGDIYVVDGYGRDYIHVFNSKGEYKTTFGGREAPYSLRSCHKIYIDKRFSPARILCCDRANLRLVHLSLEGDVIGDVATNLRKPSAIAFHGDFAAIAEINGRVSVLDKEGKTVETMGTNETQGKIGHNKTPPAEWKPGVVHSPHGISYDKEGNIYVSEYNRFGRVHRFNKQ